MREGILHRDLPLPDRFSYLGVGTVSSAASLAGIWLILPPTTARFGLIVLWAITVSVVLRTVINLELARYTCLTGEVASVGFARLFSKPKVFATIFLALGVLQTATPGWAIATATALAAAQLGRIPSAGDNSLIANWQYVTFAICVGVLALRPRITRTLKLVVGALVLAAIFLLLWIDISIVPPKMWGQGINGLVSLGVTPPGLDLLAFAGIAAFFVGGFTTASVSNWYRAEGMGIASSSYAKVSDVRLQCPPTDRNVTNFSRWWRLLLIDQWSLFCIGTLSIALLWSLLAAASSVAGNATYDAVLAGAAKVVGKRLGLDEGPAMFLLPGIAFWILFSTQLVICDVVARQVADLAYAFPTFRGWSRGDPRRIYYFSLVLFVVWSAASINVGSRGSLLTFGSGIGSLLLAMVALLTLKLNLKFPPAFRPSRTSQAGLLAGAMFFATMSVALLSGMRF